MGHYSQKENNSVVFDCLACDVFGKNSQTHARKYLLPVLKRPNIRSPNGFFSYYCVQGSGISGQSDMNRSFNFGDGFFETIRVSERQVTLWPYHCDRIINSCRAMKMTIPSPAQLDAISEELLNRTERKGTWRGRVTIYRKGDGRYLPDNSDFAWHIEVEPWEAHPQSYFPTHAGKEKDLVANIQELKPGRAGLYPNNFKASSPISNLKSTSAIIYVAAAIYGSEQGWDATFICNESGRPIETTDSNLFVLKKKTLYTPPLTEGCVAGVCRAYLMNRFDCLELPLRMDDLKDVDLIFITNALAGIRRIELV